jgi:hypothetical protein
MDRKRRKGKDVSGIDTPASADPRSKRGEGHGTAADREHPALRTSGPKGFVSEAPADEENDIPHFRLLASDMSLASSMRAGSVQAAALQALREAFTPTQPKQTSKLFAGRRAELRRIVSAIEEWKAHVVIYGERGFGKTSLTNTVVDIARQGGITVLTCACSSELTFEEMCRGFLREIPLPFRGVPGREGGGRAAARGNLAGLLPAGPFGAAELNEALRHLTDHHVIFRLDEFDRIRDPAFKTQLAEAIKNLSDSGARVTFLIVGVAEDLDELLGRHPSIQRNVVGIHLALMSEEEMMKLIAAGEAAAGIQFDDEVKRRIASLAHGLPYQVQLLCLQCGQAAIEAGTRRVSREHLERAIDQAIALVPRAVERAYERAFPGTSREAARVVAFAAASSPCDAFGYFTLDDLARAGRNAPGAEALIAGNLSALLDELASDARGPALFRVRESRSGRRYAFIDPLMRAYLVLLAQRAKGPVRIQIK